jgi:hypothetical protein
MGTLYAATLGQSPAQALRVYIYIYIARERERDFLKNILK